MSDAVPITTVTAGKPIRRYLAGFGLEDKAPVEEVLAWLSRAVLSDGPVAGMTLDEVSAAIARETGLEIDRGELRRSIERDSQNVTITNHDVPICIMTGAARQATKEQLEAAQELEASVLTEWAGSLTTDPALPGAVQLEWLIEDFRYFYGSVALIHGAESIALYGDRKTAEEFVARLDEETWDGVQERVSGYRAFCRDAFPRFFLNASGARATFAANLLDRTLELCRLNLAPSAGRLVVKSVANAAIYLDTNVVFCLLGVHGPASHLDVRRVLELGSRAKVVARVTPQTVVEFRGAASRLMREHPGRYLPAEALLRLDPQLDDRQFLAEYRKLFTGPRLSESDLLASMNHLERTLEQYGVQVWNEGLDEVARRSEAVSALASELLATYQAAEDHKPPNIRRQIQPEKAQHDALHIVLIEALRGRRNRNVNETKNWFVTHHYSLAKKALGRAGRGTISTVLMFEQWHQQLRSVLPRADQFDATFVRSITSPLFQAHRANYFSAAQAVAARLANYTAIDDEHFARVVTDSAFAARVDSMTQQKGGLAEEDLGPLIDERLAVELRSEREMRVELSKRVESTQRDAKLLSDEMQRKTATLEAEKGAHAQRAEVLAKQLEDVEKEKASVSSKAAELQRELERRDRAVEEAARQAAARRTRRERVLQLCVGCLLALLNVPMWIWFRDGWAVKGTGLNILSATTFFLGGGSAIAISKPATRKWVMGTALFVLAALQVGAWAIKDASPPDAGDSTSTQGSVSAPSK